MSLKLIESKFVLCLLEKFSRYTAALNQSKGVLIFWNKWHFWSPVASLAPLVRVCVRGFVIRVIFRPNHLPLLDALRLGKESKSNSTYFVSCGTNRHYRLRDDSWIV